MTSHTAITVRRPREEVERLWHNSDYRPTYIHDADADVRIVDAPGDRGTEIHVELQRSGRGGPLGAVARVTGAGTLAKVKDELRRFKQLVETGEIARSDGTPEGELAERKLKQRPAQPMAAQELEQAGVR